MVNEEDNERWEYEETEESYEQEMDIIKYEISYYPTDLTLKGYLDKWEAKQLVIPKFQRSYVWDQVRASKLIESFLMGIPVPGVFLYKERETNKLLIVDGQQRIMSAINFLKGRFEDRVFKLKNVDKKWEGKTFEELSEPDRFQLHDAMLRATVIQQLDPDDDSSIFLVFERLNTGGVKLNAMEVRKCIYFGEFFKFIEDMNKVESWRKLSGRTVPDKRLRDAELILRVFALYHDLNGYDKPMKGFLNKYLSNVKEYSDEEKDVYIADLENKFIRVCDYLLEYLGEKPFHLRGRLNYAVLDSVMATLLINIDEVKENIVERYENLKKDKEYLESVSVSTSDLVVLVKRFQLAKKYLID